jgi:hypothetical protein
VSRSKPESKQPHLLVGKGVLKQQHSYQLVPIQLHCREKIGDEAVYVKSEACRAAAMAQCLAGPALPGNVLPPGKGEENMEIDESEERRSRSRSHSRGPGRAASSSGHEEMEDYSKSVRGPNQYKCASTDMMMIQEGQEHQAACAKSGHTRRTELFKLGCI